MEEESPRQGRQGTPIQELYKVNNDPFIYAWPVLKHRKKTVTSLAFKRRLHVREVQRKQETIISNDSVHFCGQISQLDLQLAPILRGKYIVPQSEAVGE